VVAPGGGVVNLLCPAFTLCSRFVYNGPASGVSFRTESLFSSIDDLTFEPLKPDFVVTHLGDPPTFLHIGPPPQPIGPSVAFPEAVRTQ
jgi:hypothetical protein